MCECVFDGAGSFSEGRSDFGRDVCEFIALKTCVWGVEEDVEESCVVFAFLCGGGPFNLPRLERGRSASAFAMRESMMLQYLKKQRTV